VQAREAHVSLQNTRLSRRTPSPTATVHWQLAQAHLVRFDRLAGDLAFEVGFMNNLLLLVSSTYLLNHVLAT
jgi:hypothetical protein